MFKSFDGFMTCLLSGTLLTALFGELNKALIFLFVMMILDFATGLMCGAYTHTISSTICIKGLMKKFMILVYIIIAHFTDYLLNVDYVKTGVCYMYGVGEVISIIETLFFIASLNTSILYLSCQFVKNCLFPFIHFKMFSVFNFFVI